MFYFKFKKNYLRTAKVFLRKYDNIFQPEADMIRLFDWHLSQLNLSLLFEYFIFCAVLRTLPTIFKKEIIQFQFHQYTLKDFYMMGFEIFCGNKLLRVTSFDKFCKQGLLRLTSFQNIENYKNRSNVCYGVVVFFVFWCLLFI